MDLVSTCFPNRRQRRPLRALLIEERPGDTEVLQSEMRREGFAPEAWCMATEPDYLARLDREVDVILIDSTLSGINGLRALDLIKASGLDVPIIVVTATASEEMAVACMKRGASDYLLKDQLGRLGQAVSQVLHEKQLRSANRQAMQALRESEARHQALLDAIPDVMLQIHRDGTLLAYKAKDADALGIPLNRLHGKKIYEEMPLDFAKLVLDHVDRALETGDLQIFEYQLPVEEGVHDFEVRAVVSGPDQTLCIIRDITQRKKVERMKNEFISVVSHELRTPMTSIAGSLGLVASGATGAIPDQAKSMIDIAHRNSERLVRLINDLLDMQKIESGKITVRLEPVALTPLIRQALEANHAYGEQYGISFELKENVTDAWVNGDTDRLLQVMANLLSNAAKFSPPEGRVDVSVSSHGKDIRVSVTDHGPGIPEDFLPRIFERFAQADTSLTRQKTGTGLGLSISKVIIERHGGEIGFESALGVGSTFYFDLPMCRVALEAEPERPVAASSEPRILICEGDRQIANALSTMLRNEGFVADTAHTDAEARRLVSQKPYDVLVLDILLADGNGIALIRELRNQPGTRHLPIVVVSAQVETTHEEIDGGAVGLADWLDRPVDANRLRDAVRRAVHENTLGRRRILHIDDDQDTGYLVATMLHEIADVEHVVNLNDAQRRLAEESYDLIILDLGLPDGSGMNLLPALSHLSGKPVPVVIYSAHELDEAATAEIAASLTKTRTSNEQFFAVIGSLLKGKSQIASYRPARSSEDTI